MRLKFQDLSVILAANRVELWVLARAGASQQGDGDIVIRPTPTACTDPQALGMEVTVISTSPRKEKEACDNPTT